MTGLRFLLAEDTPEYSAAIETVLRRRYPQAAIDQTKYSDLALNLLNEHRYDLVVTDYDYPPKSKVLSPEERPATNERRQPNKPEEYDWRKDIGYDSTKIFGGGILIRKVRSGQTKQRKDIPIIIESGHVNGSALEYLLRPELLGSANPTAFIHKEKFGDTKNYSSQAPVLYSGNVTKEAIGYFHAHFDERVIPPSWASSPVIDRVDVSSERFDEALLIALQLLDLHPDTLAPKNRATSVRNR